MSWILDWCASGGGTVIHQKQWVLQLVDSSSFYLHPPLLLSLD